MFTNNLKDTGTCPYILKFLPTALIKVKELFIIASLSVVVMDVVKDQLLFSKDGIPLGLLVAKFRFIDISYLVSNEFRVGAMGFKRRRTRCAFTLLIGVSALIAVLAGPSAALLLIPNWYAAWPAGESRFRLNGNLQPLVVDRDPAALTHCSDLAHITSQLFTLGNYNRSLSSCLWAGFPFLAEAFRQRASSGSRILSYSDGSFKRDVTVKWGVPNPAKTPDHWSDSPRVAAHASNLAIGAFSNFISQRWCTALHNSRQTRPGGTLSNFRYRVANGTNASVRSLLPVVRTQCFDAVQ